MRTHTNALIIKTHKYGTNGDTSSAPGARRAHSLMSGSEVTTITYVLLVNEFTNAVKSEFFTHID